MKSSLTIRAAFVRTTLWAMLLTGTIFSSCSKDEGTPATPADKTALQAAIATATNLVNNTSEGTRPGQYVVGSKAPLAAALNAANAVNADPNATQTSVNNTTQQLLQAITVYESNYINEIAAANLIGFWKMNGNTADSSGNANNGTATTGHATYGSGVLAPATDRFNRPGMAYHFDNGANIEIPYKTALNSPEMSLSLWIKWSSTGRTWDPTTYTMIAMNRWNGYKFQLQGGHLPFYTVRAVKPAGDTTIYDRDDAGVPVTENTWRHLVVTFKSGFMIFYIDGEPVKTWDAASSNPVPGNAITLLNPINLVIGQDLPTDKYLTVNGDFQVAWGGFFTGDMDDVMYYNIALDGPQVRSIYDNQKP